MIVLCYSSIDTNSFHEAETVIWPELNERYPDVPIILVATKCDARPDEELWSMDEGKSFSITAIPWLMELKFFFEIFVSRNHCIMVKILYAFFEVSKIVV